MKISIFSKVLVYGAAIALFTSCGNNDKSGTAIDASSIVNDASLTKEEKSEKLAKASEQLLTAQGFAYASDVADLSLQTDPSNVRAQFVKAVLAPVMAHKGLYKRVKPLADRDVEATEQYAKAIAEFDEKTPNSTINRVLKKS